MDWSNLLNGLLTLAVSYAVKWFFAQIGVVIPDAEYAAIVAGIVTWFVGLFTAGAVKAGVKSFAPKLHAALFTSEVKQ